MTTFLSPSGGPASTGALLGVVRAGAFGGFQRMDAEAGTVRGHVPSGRRFRVYACFLDAPN